MGKIRVKSFGDQEQEEKDKKLQAKRAEKKADKKALQTQAQGQEAPAGPQASEEARKAPVEAKKEAPKKKSQTKIKERYRSVNYRAKAALINRDELYSLSDALKLLGEAHMAKFDETVELHINMNFGGLSGSMTLPHGSGKATKVVIADDALISEIEKGKISFDILLAHPSMMPKLAKVARVLGPRGLMPNPKNGTITPEPEKTAKKYEGGLLSFKTEAKAPIIHLIVGKISFGTEKLSENITVALEAVKKSNILNVTLKSTMSPGIKIRI